MPNATWLADVLRAAGLRVAEQPGWKTRGHGALGTVRGVIAHHTVGPRTGNMPSLNVITHGRPGLAGPLSQLGLGRDGTYYVVAAGLAYHAGRGEWRGVTAGNSSMIGVEAENTGYTSGPMADVWPEVQLDAYARGAAAIGRHVGFGAEMVCGHKEFALPRGRKIDPTFDMDVFRARVAGVLNGGVVRPPIPAKDAEARPTLRRGSQGSLVATLQRAIGVKDDGRFGPGTEAALRAYQRAKSLTPDGVAGPAVWASLDRPTTT